MITKAIVLITCLISIPAFSNPRMLGSLIFNPYTIKRQPSEWFRFISSGFIHADFMHLAINMFVLWNFGNVVEESFEVLFHEKGKLFYLLMYITAIPAACMFTYFKQNDNPSYNALGASGAVAAIVFSFILMNPMAKLYLFGGIPINGVIFGILYLIYSSYMGKRGGDNVGHEAHFWGSVYGFVYTAIAEPALIPYFFDQISSAF